MTATPVNDAPEPLNVVADRVPELGLNVNLLLFIKVSAPEEPITPVLKRTGRDELEVELVNVIFVALPTNPPFALIVPVNVDTPTTDKPAPT